MSELVRALEAGDLDLVKDILEKDNQGTKIDYLLLKIAKDERLDVLAWCLELELDSIEDIYFDMLRFIKDNDYNVKVISYLINNLDLNFEQLHELFIEALVLSDLQIVEYIVERNIELRDTAFVEAIIYDELDIVEYLIDIGSDVKNMNNVDFIKAMERKNNRPLTEEEELDQYILSKMGR